MIHLHFFCSMVVYDHSKRTIIVFKYFLTLQTDCALFEKILPIACVFVHTQAIGKVYTKYTQAIYKVEKIPTPTKNPEIALIEFLTIDQQQL